MPTRATQFGNQVNICAKGVPCSLKINGGTVKNVQTLICVNLAMMEQMRTNSQSLTSLTTPCNSILGMMPNANYVHKFGLSCYFQYVDPIFCVLFVQDGNQINYK